MKTHFGKEKTHTVSFTPFKIAPKDISYKINLIRVFIYYNLQRYVLLICYIIHYQLFNSKFNYFRLQAEGIQIIVAMNVLVFPLFKLF